MKKALFYSFLVFVMVLTACTPSVPIEEEAPAEETSPAEDAAPAEELQPEPVTLEFYHWFGADIGDLLINEINDKFHAENPNITIDFETAETDTYEQVIATRLSAGDAPDIFGVFPGTKFHPTAEAGYLMDLSDEIWVANLFEGAKFVSTYEGKVMTMPVDANVIGVIYNKQIFTDLGLEIPTDWESFLDTCEIIKGAGIAPVALGMQDAWVTQLVPYAMAPSAIYRDNLDFDAELYAGESTFVGSEWEQMMADYVDLRTLGYVNQDEMGTGYDLANDLMANGDAAMLVQGNWAVATLREKAPDVEWGMFPLPYDAGGDVWVSSAVGITIAISADTEYPEEARKYLEFWARPDIAELYLEKKGAFPVSVGVNPVIDPAAGEMIPYLEVGSYPFLDQNWPAGVQDAMFVGIQSVFTGEVTITEMLEDMDTAWVEGMDQ